MRTRPLQETEPASIPFLLVLEEELHAEADAQEWPSLGDDFADDVDQPELVETVHRGTGRADAGENDGVGLAHVSGCQTRRSRARRRLPTRVEWSADSQLHSR